MGSYVPNTSRRVLGILVFFWGGEASASQLPRVLFFQDFRFFLNLFDQIFFEFYSFGHFSILRHRKVMKHHSQSNHDLKFVLSSKFKPSHRHNHESHDHFFPQHLVEGLLNFRRRVCRSFWLDLAFQDPPGKTDQCLK